jgi:AraC-like DNA-binding protein
MLGLVSRVAPAAGAPRPPTAAQVERMAHLRAAKDLLDRAYAQPLDLDALARRAGYSRFHFARAFRAAFGDTPGHYLTRRRVERAQDLLRTANLSVTEICLLVGFSSLGSFSARFKRLVGVSPSQYRERAVLAGGPPPIPGCFVLMWSGAAAPDGLRSGSAPAPAAAGGEARPARRDARPAGGRAGAAAGPGSASGEKRVRRPAG